jgi:hypothetical protein
MNNVTNLSDNMISARVATLCNFAALINLQNVRLIILTAIGIIEGNFSQTFYVAKDTDVEATSDNSLNSKLFDKNEELFNQIEKENPNISYLDSSARILLTDVTLTPSGSPTTKYKLAELFIFVDQIIGFHSIENSES